MHRIYFRNLSNVWVSLILVLVRRRSRSFLVPIGSSPERKKYRPPTLLWWLGQVSWATTDENDISFVSLWAFFGVRSSRHLVQGHSLKWLCLDICKWQWHISISITKVSVILCGDVYCTLLCKWQWTLFTLYTRCSTFLVPRSPPQSLFFDPDPRIPTYSGIVPSRNLFECNYLKITDTKTWIPSQHILCTPKHQNSLTF